MGISSARSVFLTLCPAVCVCARARCTGTPASCDVRLTAIIRVYHRSAPHSFPFVPSVCAPPGLVSTQCGLQQRPVVVCSRLIKLVSVTGKLHLKHMAMSVPFTQHSMFSRSTEQTANEPRSDERKTTATEHLEDNITNEACMFVFFPLLLVCTYLHARRWMRTGCLHVSAHVFSCHSYRRVRGDSVCTRSQFTS